ncbi:MAG: glycosyltransferase family 4 protein [Puniceicoccales bacterium]|jgi:glycosyltransferase involved in cell wall biosynthesis|nr:glycosyltransferase family 4 protein [Puniceicoccales bacterium]
MKKVLFLFNPGAINLRHVLIQEFSKKGLSVAVGLSEEEIAIWQNRLPNVSFVQFDAFSGTSVGLLNNFKILLHIRSLLKQKKPDMVFFGNVKPNVYGGLVSRWLKIKNIYGLVSGLGYAFIEQPGVKRTFIKHICMRLYKLSFKGFTHVFFQNQDDRVFFIQHGLVDDVRSSVVNGTGVDLQAFAPQPFPATLTFFMAARLIEEKGVFHYVEAARQLKTKYPHVRFVLAGNIDTNPSAITEEQLKHYANIIEYIGYCSQMAEQMSQSSVFVYPSYYREGVPRALLEALACGRPVITTDNVGCKETVTDGENGFKIQARSTEALLNAMEKIIRQPELLHSMGLAGRKLAEKKFDIHAVNAAIFQTVQNTCS